MVLNTEWAQVEVIDLINDGSGLAFGIIGGRSTGVVVKTILPGGVADRDGRLQSGDHILQIGDVNIRGLGSEQVASVLRQCGVHVRMVVARPVEPTSNDYQTLGSHAPIVPTKLLGDLDELDRHLIENGYAETFCHTPPDPYSTEFIYTRQQSDIELHPMSGIVDVVRDPLPIGTVPTIPSPSTPVVEVELLPLDMALKGSPTPETETYSVELQKDELGLGITVAGYVCEKEEISGIFVKSISAGSAADLSRKIRINDRIIEVDGITVVGHTNHQAVQRLRHTSIIVSLKFERYLRGPKYEQLQQAIRANELKFSSPPLSPSLASLPRIPISLLDTSYMVEPEGESRTSIDIDSSVLLDPPTPVNEVEIVIDERCSVLHHHESYNAIKDKWREIIGSEVEIVVAELIKDINGGLGISLEGTVDVEDGQEVRPHHYIRSVLPDGPVGRNGLLQSGDELLEVNNTRLLGLNHVEVVSILRKLPQNVCLICARYGPPQRRIIDTAQDRNAFAARNILAGSLQNLIPMSEGMVKAKSESSLASTSTIGTCQESELSHSRSKSRSLEMHVGLAMWCDDPEIIELSKGDKGLGFSILDYQDPLNPKETVIVVRSLVPGGVAHNNGRLIPGDRLLYVNETSLVGASLDRAVQVLKGAPKGIVRIGVAKPLSSHDTISQSSQMSSLSFQECVSDTDDHTCLEDYHECIEEYQECLEVMHICLDDGRKSYACTPCDSHENLNLADSSSITYNLNETLVLHNESNSAIIPNLVNYDKKFHNFKCDSPKRVNICETTTTFSVKVPDDSDREGYETCQEDSDSSSKIKLNNSSNKSLNDEHNFLDNNIDSCVSEPCIRKKIFSKRNHVCLETKIDDIDLKSYDDENNSFGADQFFLVDYIDDDVSEELQPEVPEKWISEPNVTEERTISRRFRKFLREYYNDYADCMDEYRKYSEMQNTPDVDKSSETIVNTNDNNQSDLDLLTIDSNFLPIKSSSSPRLSQFLEPPDEWDLFLDKNRRKSATIPGYDDESDVVSMTVTRNIDAGCLASADTAAMLEKHWGSTHTVQVEREPNSSLGISIVGGKVDLFKSGEASETLLGIFVKSVVPNSPAGRTTHFKTGDRILEVGGVNLRQATHEKAVEAIRNADNPVNFLIQSLIPWANGNENEINSDVIDNRLSKEPVSPYPSNASISEAYPEVVVKDKHPPAENDTSIIQNSIAKTPTFDDGVESLKLKKEDDKTDELAAEKVPEPATPDMDRIPEEDSDEDSDDEEDVRELEGKMHTAKGHEIDRASAANVKRTKEEAEADPEEEDDYGYTNNKVKKKYATLGHSVQMVQLERGGQGLGLSLAGHRDRNCMAVFVCGLNPAGAAFRTGGIQVGDEILEVNGIVLHGRCHLNASAIIKGLSGPIFKVIILRRKTALEDIAVRPITQFPITLADETAEQKYATYPNVRTVSIKKGMHSLGIMIIEGRHAEVGQGIFISDIQEGSAAEKAGLDIGEMILAVNKDTLLCASYDAAAGLLKRTEGLVNLIVSNPNKRVPSPVPGLEITGVADMKNDISTPHKSTTGLKTSAPPSRPTTPIAGEIIADPATCQIIPGKEMPIEITTEGKNLGLAFVGGRDSLISGGIVVLEVYPDGAAKKDGRLQPGDQLIDVLGTSLLDVTNATAISALRQILPKFKIIVFRPEKLEMTTIDVELTKKPGKGIGLSLIAPKTGDGIYIAEILNGSSADIDGRLMRGDRITSVNEQQVTSLAAEQVATLLKTTSGRVTIKLQRHKPQIR